MAIPTDYIFQSGTCLKSQIYQLIIDKLVAAGWQNISSNPTTDFVVLKSVGNTGDRELLLNLRPVNVNAAQSVETTNYCGMSVRLQDTYTPGEEGVAGTFGRPSLGWSWLYIVPISSSTGVLPANTQVTYKCYADASKIILVLEYPYASGYSPYVIYMGEPDSLYCTEGASRGVIIGTSASNVSGTANTVHVSNTPVGLGTVTAPYVLNTYATLSPKNPNNAGKYALSHIYYGSATEGSRGRLDGLYALPNTNIVTGDHITLGVDKYYVLSCHVVGTNAFQSAGLAVRIS